MAPVVAVTVGLGGALALLDLPALAEGLGAVGLRGRVGVRSTDLQGMFGTQPPPTPSGRLSGRVAGLPGTAGGAVARSVESSRRSDPGNMRTGGVFAEDLLARCREHVATTVALVLRALVLFP